METMFAAAAILSPIGLLFAIGIPAIAILVARRPGLGAGHLAAGYLGALLTLAVLVAITSYVSPEEAIFIWKVQPDRYWGALFELFLSTYVVSAFAVVVGISFAGLPALLWLSAGGKATVPRLVLASLVISLTFSILLIPMWLGTHLNPLEIAAFMFLPHATCALGFGLAARLPWRVRIMQPNKSLERSRDR